MIPGALSDLTVLECAEFISGPFCAKLLADLGANVIKVEPPAGERARRAGPFPADEPHPDKSGLFIYLNTSKRGITLELDSPAGVRLFRALARRDDVLIENYPLAVMARRGLTAAALRQDNPGLVVTSISAFGHSGPKRNYRATNLVSMHMGGIGYYTPGLVDSERQPPLKGGGHQAEFVAGYMAALQTMAAVLGRQTTGQGQHIDLSTQEAVAFNLMRDIAMYTCSGVQPGRVKGKVQAFGHFLPCADGYVQLYMTNERQWEAFVELLGNPAWAKDERYATTFSRVVNVASLEEHIKEWTATRTKQEIYHALQVRHVAAAPVNTMDEVLASPQLAARGFFVSVPQPEAGPLTCPGGPCALSETPFRVRRPAPRLGEHNVEIICGELGYSRADLVRLRALGAI